MDATGCPGASLWCLWTPVGWVDGMALRSPREGWSGSGLSVFGLLVAVAAVCTQPSSSTASAEGE